MENEHFHPLSKISKQIRKKRNRIGIFSGYLILVRNIVIVIALFNILFMVTIVRGTEMYPAILDGDVVLSYRIGRNFVQDDVVIYTANDEKHMGRVVARAGDYVDITENGRLYVNGTEQTTEIAFPTYPSEDIYPFQVPEDCVYILGDYRTNTRDSRDYGPINVSDVQAKVVSIFRRRGF